MSRNDNSPPDPVIISWSGLKRHENCKQHQLRHIRKEVDKPNMGRTFLPGTIVDLTQRRWLESDNPETGEMSAMVDTIMDETIEHAEWKIHWKGAEDKGNVIAFCKDTVTKLEPWLCDNVLPYDYQPEVRFTAFHQVPFVCGSYGLLKMIGGIDLVVRKDNGKFGIYDLKTTKSNQYITSTLAQLTFYDLAWGLIQEDFYHADSWGLVVPAMPELFIPTTVEREDRQALMSRIVKYAEGVWNDNWSPKSDDTGCDWCPAKRMCDKFQNVVIPDANGKMRASFLATATARQEVRNRTKDA